MNDRFRRVLLLVRLVAIASIIWIEVETFVLIRRLQEWREGKQDD